MEEWVVEAASEESTLAYPFSKSTAYIGCTEIILSGAWADFSGTSPVSHTMLCIDQALQGHREGSPVHMKDL